MTKLCNLDIKRQSKSKSYDQHGLMGQILGGVIICNLLWEVFLNKRDYSWVNWLDPLIYIILDTWRTNRKYPLLEILSPIEDVKSPVGDNISSWGLGISESGTAESENKS